jgi:cardiolipin synthase
MKAPAVWDEEELFHSGDEYFSQLLRAIAGARSSLLLESYIFEKGTLGDRMVEHLIAAAARGVKVRMIIDGWGSPTFIHDYYPRLRAARIRVKFYRVSPWILKRMPGDPRNLLRRLVLRWKRVNRGNHRKFCLIDREELWVGSFNVSDKHLREIQGDEAWKDVGVRVRGNDLKYARRAFDRAYRGWSAINLPARNPRLLLLNDSFLHMRQTRIEHIRRLKKAHTRIWLATPYFVPIGRIFRLLARRAKQGIDVRLIIPEKNDVWIMRWISLPLLRSLARKGVKIFVYRPRFSHQKVFIADDWICVGSTNLNHRSFLHDLEMDVVITRPENKQNILDGYVRDQRLSQGFDTSEWAQLAWWKRALSSVFLVLKYWS